jgi:hypothetical protein
MTPFPHGDGAAVRASNGLDHDAVAAMAGFHDNAGTADAHVDIGLSDLNVIRLGSSGEQRRSREHGGRGRDCKECVLHCRSSLGSEAIPTKDRHNRSAGAGEKPRAIGDINLMS